MTRWLIRLAFPALGLLLALIFFGVKAPEPETESTEVAKEAAALTPFEAMVPAPVAPEGPDIVFKWQDSSGNWHYADEPPEEGPWNTLAIEPGDETRPTSPQEGGRDQNLGAPYTAPFALDPDYPGNGS
ncbi:MAG: DUF4124 domain-containing protein [Marinobacter sp.]